jgi:hypothetical protein
MSAPGIPDKNLSCQNKEKIDNEEIVIISVMMRRRLNK